MVQALAASLILAAISGISYLAYKYPKAYSRLYPWLFAIVAIPYLAIGLWDTALSAALERLKLSLVPDQAEIGKSILIDLSIPLTIPTIGFFLYTIFLIGMLFLPNLLKE